MKIISELGIFIIGIIIFKYGMISNYYIKHKRQIKQNLHKQQFDAKKIDSDEFESICDKTPAFEVPKSVYDNLVSKYNDILDIKDINPKLPPLDIQPRHNNQPEQIRKPINDTSPRKNNTQLFIGHDNSKLKNEIKKDQQNNQKRLKELKKLRSRSPLNNKCVRLKHLVFHNKKPPISLKMHLAALKNFFYWLIKGFDKIKGKKETVSYHNKSIVLFEDIKMNFDCETTQTSSIDYDLFLDLKEAVLNIDYRNYKKTMNDVTLKLREIANKVSKKCKGLDFVIDVIGKYINNMSNDVDIDYLLNIPVMRNKALSELDKFSFPEGGYTIGQIFGEAKKYSFYLNDLLDKPKK